MARRILFSNIGYAKGIDGRLRSHLRLLHRHVYSGPSVQKQVLSQLKSIIDAEKPDLCCFVEIDSGSFHSAQLNQLRELADEEYVFHDIAGKYGEESRMGRMPLHAGKSNGFLSKTHLPFQKLYFTHGTKRLIYALDLPDKTRLLFAHFSLSRKTRARQFAEIKARIKEIPGPVMLLADFNIMRGFSELAPLLEGTDLKVLNRPDEHTFQFYRSRHTLDLCICSEALASRASLKVIPQPFSDHAALLIEIRD